MSGSAEAPPPDQIKCEPGRQPSDEEEIPHLHSPVLVVRGDPGTLGETGRDGIGRGDERHHQGGGGVGTILRSLSLSGEGSWQWNQ